jgi:two-component system, cell cycle sensor histidine kinase and response regulator CckA
MFHFPPQNDDGSRTGPVSLQADYETVLDILPDAVFVHDAATGRILEVNESCLRMFLYSPDVLRTLDIGALSCEEEGFTMERALEHIAQVRDHEEARFDWRSKRADGSVFWSEVRLVSTGTPSDVRILAVVRDVSDRIETQERLRVSEERLRFAIEGSSDGLWDVEMDSNSVYMSPRGLEILDYLPEEMPYVASVWQDLVHPEDLDRTQIASTTYLEGRSPLFQVQQRLKTKSGEWKWILARGKATERSKDGTVLRMTGTHTDLTDRMQMDHALKTSEDKFSKVFFTSPDAITITRLSELKKRLSSYRDS